MEFFTVVTLMNLGFLSSLMSYSDGDTIIENLNEYCSNVKWTLKTHNSLSTVNFKIIALLLGNEGRGVNWFRYFTALGGCQDYMVFR